MGGGVGGGGGRKVVRREIQSHRTTKSLQLLYIEASTDVRTQYLSTSIPMSLLLV